MRILFLTYADLSLHSAEKTHVEELYHSFERLGHDVRVICRKPPENKDYHHPFPFVNLPFLSLITKGLESLTMRSLVKKSSLGCDLIYKRHDINGFFAELGYNLNLPVILEVNGSAELEKRFNESKGHIIRKAKETDIKSIKKADMIVVVSNGLKDYYIRNGIQKEKIHVIQNGFNPKIFRPMDKSQCRKKLGLADRPMALFVGDIRPWHGVEYAIEAIGIVKRDIDDITLLVVGGNRDSNKRLSGIVDSLGLKKNITLVSRVPYDKVPIYINSADVCIAPFIRERNYEVGFSAIKLFEYSGCKKAIITTKLPCVEDVFTHMKDVYLVQPNNAEDLASAIVKIIRSRPLREKLSKNSHSLSKKYTWDENAKKTLDVMSKLLERN